VEHNTRRLDSSVEIHRTRHRARQSPALNRFARLGGRHRTFLDVHLAKSRLSRVLGRSLPPGKPREGVTLKDVKKRWGRGQEDAFPVAQFEKLWGT
jgi:hypothetical protein